jgi:hypothetical protein
MKGTETAIHQICTNLISLEKGGKAAIFLLSVASCSAGYLFYDFHGVLRTAMVIYFMSSTGSVLRTAMVIYFMSSTVFCIQQWLFIL